MRKFSRLAASYAEEIRFRYDCPDAELLVNGFEGWVPWLSRRVHSALSDVSFFGNFDAAFAFHLPGYSDHPIDF
jgi:hypothetical protein